MDLKRPAGQQKKAVLLLLSLVSLIGLLAVAAQTAPQQATETDEQCILCHVETYNFGLRKKFSHSPFFARNCSVCHRPAGAREVVVPLASRPQTGLAVDQQPLWRKQQRFAGEGLALEHLATLSGLQADALYRFRLQLGEEPDQSSSASLWLGLKPAELLPSESREIPLTGKLASGSERSFQNLSVTSLTADTLLISWQTAVPLFSWLELQELDGVESTAANSREEVQSAHPQLRDPVEAAINACYQCHPESSLGASHPVRLYGGRDVRIPESLPTVDGMLTCVTCHDPHGGPGKMLVREIIKTKLCVTCHYKYKNSSPSTMFRD